MTETAHSHPLVGEQPAPDVLTDQPESGLAAWGIASLAIRHERAAHIWSITRAERIRAYVRGELTSEQIQGWSGRAPRELPQINGEFAHIAASTPEACFRCPVCGDDEVALATGGVLSNHLDRRNTGPADTVNPRVCLGSGTHPGCATEVPPVSLRSAAGGGQSVVVLQPAEIVRSPR